MALSDLKKTSLTEIAYEEIRKNILTGRMPPGHKLIVNDLVAQWNISNTPIKEALNRLVAEGMVVFEPRYGMRVRDQLSAKELRDKFEVRMLYEIHCCRVAAVAVDKRPDVLVELRTTMERYEALLHDKESYFELYRYDEIFHRLIVSLCGNNEIIRAFDHLHLSILTFGVLASKHFPLRRQPETCEEHKRILDALERRSPDEMAEAMRTHLDNTASGLLAYYNSASGRFFGEVPADANAPASW